MQGEGTVRDDMLADADEAWAEARDEGHPASRGAASRHRTASRPGGGAVVTSALAGAAALAVLDRLEARLLGGPAVYAPRVLASRLARRYLGREPSPAVARVTGVALRGAYAASLATAYAWLRAVVRRAPMGRACAFGAAVATGERTVLPRIGATPRIAAWSPRERRLLYVQATTFCVVVEGTLGALAARTGDALG